MRIKEIGSGLKHHIVIDANTLREFKHILNSKYNKEFTAFTHCERLGNGGYLIKDLFIPNQTNTEVHTEVDSDDLVSLMKDGADISQLSGHIHSHVNMPVQPSKTDEDEIIERAKHSDFNAAIIINKKGEIYGHIVDLELGLHLQDVDVRIQYPHQASDLEDYVVSQAKKKLTYQDLKKLVNITNEGYFNLCYPLSDTRVDELNSYVKTRFKERLVGFYNPNSALSNAKKSYVTQTHNKKRVDDMDYNEYMAYLNNKPYSDLTDAEWEDLESFYETY